MINHETILSRVCAIAEVVKDDPTASAMLDDLRGTLEAAVRERAARSKGRGNAARTLTAILTAQKKNDRRETLHYAWLDAAGRQCVCNGFQAFRLNTPLPLEPRPADAPKPFDLDKIFPTPECIASDYQAIKLPDAAAVKAFIAVERAKNGRKAAPVWDFGDGLPAVNARFLLDLYAVFPDASEAYIKTDYTCYNSPMFVKAEGGDALLLPLMGDVKRAAFRAERDAAQAAREEETRREWEKQEAAKLLTHALNQYSVNVAEWPEYGLSPEEFANMAHWSAICNAA